MQACVTVFELSACAAPFMQQLAFNGCKRTEAANEVMGVLSSSPAQKRHPIQFLVAYAAMLDGWRPQDIADLDEMGRARDKRRQGVDEESPA